MGKNSIPEDRVKANLDALLATIDEDFSDVPTSTGPVAIRGATPFEWIALSRKYTSFAEMLSIGNADDFPDEDDEEAFKKFQVTRAKAIQDALMKDGPEAACALIATCAGLSAHREKVIEKLVLRPHDDIEALLEASMKRTMPEGIGDFFGKVNRTWSLMQGMTIVRETVEADDGQEDAKAA